MKLSYTHRTACIAEIKSEVLSLNKSVHGKLFRIGWAPLLKHICMEFTFLRSNGKSSSRRLIPLLCVFYAGNTFLPKLKSSKCNYVKNHKQNNINISSNMYARSLNKFFVVFLVLLRYIDIVMYIMTCNYIS